MQLTDEQIEEFRRLYVEHGGDSLSKDDAAALAEELITLVLWLYELDG